MLLFISWSQSERFYARALPSSDENSLGKKVALKTLILSNIEAPSARLLKQNIFLATLQYSDVF
jgi:hypothetical protein